MQRHRPAARALVEGRPAARLLRQGALRQGERRVAHRRPSSGRRRALHVLGGQRGRALELERLPIGG